MKLKSLLMLPFVLLPMLVGGCDVSSEETVADKSYIYGMTDLSYQETDVDYHYTHKLFKNMGVKSVRIWMHCNWIMKSPTEYSTSGLAKMKAIYEDVKKDGYQIIAMNHSNFHKTGMTNSAKTTAKPHRDLSEGSYYLEWLSDLETTYYNMVLQFPDIKYWEIDNECNNDDFMPALGGVAFDLDEKAEVYYDMMYYASRGIHRANPDAVTVMGGLVVWNAESFLEKIYDLIEEEDSWSTNPDDYFQVACWHPYMSDFSKDKFIELNNEIYSVVKRREGKDKKVFLTEAGFSENNNYSIADQTKYIKDMYDACKDDLSYVESCHYFRMYDEYSSTWGSDAEKTYGLFYDPTTEKTNTESKVYLAQPKDTAYVYQSMAGGEGSLDVYKDFLNGDYSTQIVMHRGYSTKARENTVKAFTLAAEQPDVAAIETDVWLTQDNKPILIHDEDTGRVSMYKYNLGVKSSTFDELRAIRLPDINGLADQEQIPSLPEYIDVLKTHNKKGFIELKEDFNDDQLNIILTEIENSGYSLENITFISFYRNTIDRLKTMNKGCKLMYLVNSRNELTDDDITKMKSDNIGVGVDYSGITDDELDLLKEEGITTNLWTINLLDIAKKYGKKSVDYITTDCIPTFKS